MLFFIFFFFSFLLFLLHFYHLPCSTASFDPWDPTLRKTLSNTETQPTETDHKSNSVSTNDDNWTVEESPLQISDPIQNRRHSRTPSPTKSKLNLLENFKSVLGRSKTKPNELEEIYINGIRIGENGHGNWGSNDKISGRRWSELQHGGQVRIKSANR